MKAITALLLLLLSLLLSTDAKLLSRQRRRIDQLGHMISATTGRHFTAYIGYGNYCGKGGAGVPVDNIDRCCKVHDQCFGIMTQKNIDGKCGPLGRREFNTYTSKFNYSSQGNGRFECLDSRSSDYSTCLFELCQCDKKLADCLRPFKDEYNDEYLKASQEKLRKMVRLVDANPWLSDFAWSIAKFVLG